MKFQLLIATVKSDLTETITKAAKKAGAPGCTVLPAHGTGIHEAKTFFGIELDISTDMVVFLLEERLVEDVLEAIRSAGEFDKPGTGIAFVMPVMKVIGLQAQIPHFQRLLKRQDVSTGSTQHQIVKEPE
ncbi:MAG: P-II family nitrogen regulator [Magnetococcales bacterium]|nr:P-II family nitrogen regulator [Magnetococcales bacterium]